MGGWVGGWSVCGREGREGKGGKGREGVWEDVVLMLSLCPWGFSVFGDSRCAMPLGTCAFRVCVCVCACLSWKTVVCNV